MCHCGSPGILRLPSTCQNCRNRRSDIISKKNRDRARKSENTRHAIRPRLRCKILQYRNGCTAALHDQRHQSTYQNSQNRNVRHLPDQIRKHRAGRQRFHNVTHRLNSKEQKSKSKYRLSDVLHLFIFRKK